MRFLHWLTGLLDRPRAHRWVIAIALLLCAPSLTVPLVMDDRMQAHKAELAFRDGEPTRLFREYFTFLDGDVETARWEMEDGFFPWWTRLDMQVSFWRPLSTATHIFDFAIYPGSAFLMHLHTLGWLSLLLFALFRLYRRFESPPVAILALALYAWDESRGFVVSFIANRNALIAALLGVLVLLAHDRWRRDGWRPGAVLGPVLLSLGLLAGESAIATTGFLFGHALFLDEGTRVKRLLRLVPYGAVVVVWQLGYSAMGYGAIGSGVYLHPVQDPAGFLLKLVERAPLLAQAQLTTIATDTYVFMGPTVQGIMLASSVLALGLIGRLLWSHVVGRRHMYFWLTGAGLALVPISATFPADRLLVFVGIGAMPVLARFFTEVLASPPTTRFTRWGVFALVAMNLVLTPLALPVRSTTMSIIAHWFELTGEDIPGAEAKDQTLVAISAASEATFGYTFFYRRIDGAPRPKAGRLLAGGASDVTVTRVDETTLRLAPARGFFPSESQQLLRNPRTDPFQAGDRVTLSDLEITVVEATPDGRPAIVDVHFDAPLEAPKWRWVYGRGFHLEPFELPAIGESVTVPAAL